MSLWIISLCTAHDDTAQIYKAASGSCFVNLCFVNLCGNILCIMILNYVAGFSHLWLLSAVHVGLLTCTRPISEL